MTSKYDSDKLYKALVDAIWYNGMDAFWQLYKKLGELAKPTDNYKKEKISLEEVPAWESEDLSQYWTIFVLMFGSYDCSPRCGWIYRTNDCIEFFNEIKYDLECIEETL